MAHLSWALLAEPLHCKEQLACDVDGDMGQDEEDMACLTAESNLSCMSEDSFSSSGSCAPHVASLSSKAAHQQQHKAADSPYDVDALLAEQEEATPRPSGYLHTTQAATGVSPVHRATVVDNMVSAAARLALTNDSLFTAVAVLDRYLALKPTPLPLLQPTAIACLWVAAKYEQLVVPPVAQFALLVQGADACLGGGSSALGRTLLVELEADVLAVLEFRLAAIVTVKSFKAALMSRLQGSKAAAGLCRRQLDQLYCMASYLTEVSMLEYRLLCCPPSQVAAAAFVYAFMLLGLPYADAVLLTGYTQEGLQALLEMFCALHTTLSAALQLRRPYNVTVKYCSPAVRGVAHIPPELRVEQRAW